MSPRSSIILLDTMVVAGWFAVSRPIQEHIDAWETALQNLMSHAPESTLQVPTSVCFELMCWNEPWRNKIVNENLTIFRYHSYSITSDILEIASKYSIESRVSFYDGTKHKVKSFDPITAAYCIKFGHGLITTNEKDFPESHFEVVDVEIVKLQQENRAIKREDLYLLKPRV